MVTTYRSSPEWPYVIQHLGCNNSVNIDSHKFRINLQSEWPEIEPLFTSWGCSINFAQVSSIEKFDCMQKLEGK